MYCKIMKKIEKMFRVKKYFHIRNQRVRISTKRIINRNFIIFLKKPKTSTGFLDVVY